MSSHAFNDATGILLNPRYETATATPPGDRVFWEMMLDQSDVFALRTAMAGKGGPFGAQLWLVNPNTSEYVLVGTEERPEDSNAVVSKGIGSAHAEAENLSIDKRLKVTEFLEAHRGEGWVVVQVHTEACPACRAKQSLFALELQSKGLIGPDGFHSIFKFSFGQTQRDAGFSDEAYDTAFRAINALNIMDAQGDQLLALEDRLKANRTTSTLVNCGKLVYVPVKKQIILHPQSGWQKFLHDSVLPAAVVIATNGRELARAVDERVTLSSPVNAYEETAIVKALHQASISQKRDGAFGTWNLQGARVYTNIADISPLDMAEGQWCNTGDITFIGNYTHRATEEMAKALPKLSNRDLFAAVAAEYNSPLSPIKVTFMGNPAPAATIVPSRNIPGEMSAAHAYWGGPRRILEEIMHRQVGRLRELAGMNVRFIDGTAIDLTKLVAHSTVNTHYDGKQAAPKPTAAP